MKTTTLLRVIILLVAVLFFGITLTIGFLCDALTPNFWINEGFLFLLAAFLFAMTMTKSASNRTFLPFTVGYARALVIYVTLAAVSGLILMYIKHLPWIVPLIVHVLGALIFGIFIATSSVGMTHIKEVHKQQTAQVQYLIMLESKLGEARDMCEDPANKVTYEKIIRMVQNSSYKSYPEVQDLERELLDLADTLPVQDNEAQAATLKRIYVLLNKRKTAVQYLRQGG